MTSHTLNVHSPVGTDKINEWLQKVETSSVKHPETSTANISFFTEFGRLNEN